MDRSGVQEAPRLVDAEGAPLAVALPTKYTVNVINNLLGKAHFVGTFDDKVAAETYAVSEAARTRKFVTYEVWTGTPRQPGRPTGFQTQGTK